MNTTPTLEIGQMLTIAGATVTITTIKGRWVKLSNGASISRGEAFACRADYNEQHADELEAGIDRAPTNEEAAAGPEQTFIEQVAAELDTTPEDAHVALMPVGYVGPMLALRERLAAGAYKKAPNGQPCCGDEIAVALGSLTPAQVIRACIIAMNLPNNPYTHLNIGQQSMNLRNKLRGCMKRGEFGMGVVVEAVEVVLETDAKSQAKADAGFRPGTTIPMDECSTGMNDETLFDDQA